MLGLHLHKYFLDWHDKLSPKKKHYYYKFKEAFVLFGIRKDNFIDSDILCTVFLESIISTPANFQIKTKFPSIIFNIYLQTLKRLRSL